jgi:hypothetical protein
MYLDTTSLIKLWKLFIQHESFNLAPRSSQKASITIYMARRQYQSSLDQINSFREFLAYFWLYIRLHPTVDENVVLHQYHPKMDFANCY